MKEAGFTYIPFIPKFDTENDDLPDSQEEAVARWGFDISTTLEAQYSGKGYGPAKLVEEDPNIAIFKEFSRQEQAAYEQAMIECAESADKELGPPPGAAVDDGSAMRREEEVQREVEKNKRVVKATRAWRTCMSGQGYDAVDPDQLRDSIRERAEPFVAEYDAAVNAELDEFVKSGTDSDWPGSDLRPADVLSPEEFVALTKLQKYEMDAAAADLVCGKELRKVMIEVFKEKHAEANAK